MEEGNDSIGELINILTKNNIGKIEYFSGNITCTKILTIDLPNNKQLILRDGDYDNSAEIYLEL